MPEQIDIPTVALTPELCRALDERITTKVAEQLAGIRAQVEQALRQSDEAAKRAPARRATLVVFSGDMDKLMAAFIIATGAVTMGLDASMFFTFWGLSALKRTTVFKGKPMTEKLMALMLPSGPASVGTSKMNMLGMGPVFFKTVMKKHNVKSLGELISLAREVGVRMVACQMAMQIMGIRKEELIDGVDFGGVATYLKDASDSTMTLFI